MAFKKGSRYVCRPCGLEVVVGSAGAGVGQLVCCESVMTTKSAKKKKKKRAKKR